MYRVVKRYGLRTSLEPSSTLLDLSNWDAYDSMILSVFVTSIAQFLMVSVSKYQV